jgi:hypothetical protein
MHLDKRQRWPRNAQLPPVLNHASCARPAASAAVTPRPDFHVFANREAAERWFEENDPEGVAFEYEVLE